MIMSFEGSKRLKQLKLYKPKTAGSETTLKLDANEGSESQPMAEALFAALKPEHLTRYSRPHALEAELAANYGIDPERVVVSAGGDDALLRLCQAYLEPGRKALVTAPSFEMIPRYARFSGGEVVETPWLRGPFPVDAMLEAIQTHRPTMGFVVTPSSPAGEVAKVDDLKKLAAALETIQGILVVDLAYVEFADHDPCQDLLNKPNIVVTRTFSKAWALAGLRVGYTLGPVEVTNALRTLGQPYAVSTPSLAMAAVALSRFGRETQARIDQVRSERSRLFAWLKEAGLNPIPSQANFVLAQLGERAWPLTEALAFQGVSVRYFDQGPVADCVRITCPGDEFHFQTLMLALEQAQGALS